MDEDVPAERLEVTVGSNRVEACERSGTAPAIRVDCTYQVSGSEAEEGEQKSVAIRVFASDAALNSAVLQGSIFVDRLAPRLESMTFAPRYAGAGTRAVFRSITSEATDGPPVLFWSGSRDPGFVWSATASADIDHVFLLDVGESSEAGDYTIERIELDDVFGNRRVYDGTNDERFPLVITIDNVAPRVLDLVVSPERVGLNPGAIVTLDFAIDEERPVGPPRVSLEGMDISSTCTPGRVTGTITRWSCRYVVTGMEVIAPGEALFVFTVETQDVASGFASTSAPVTFDFRPPSLNAAVFTPAAASNGDVGQFYLAASEPLDPAFVPVLGWAGPAVPLVYQPSRATSSERYYEVVVGPNITAGEYTLSTVVLRDVAGNETTINSGVLPLEWLDDPVAPQAQNLTVRVCAGAAASSCGPQTTPPRVPAIAGRVLRVEFTENEANPAEVAVRCGPRDLSSSCTFTGAAPSRSWTCLYTTTGNEYPAGTEAAESCVADLTDRSANRSSAIVPLIFDYAPPALSSISILPSPGGLGANATLTMVFSEELEAGFIPTLAFNPANRSIPFVHQSSTPFQRVFTYTITAASTPRIYSLSSVTARDLAGNNATITSAPLPLSWLLDNVPPAIGAITVTVPDAVVATTPPRINRTAGRRINVVFTVTEANPRAGTPQVSIGSIDISSSCTSAGNAPNVTWTCSYTMTGSEAGNGSETVHFVDVRVADTAGNTGNDSASILFDFRGPALVAGTSALTLVPSANNRLRNVSAVRDGTEIVLAFRVDETLAGAPAITATGKLVFTVDAGSTYLARHTLAPTTTQGTRSFSITATDLAGNVSIIGQGLPTFTVDTNAPNSPAVGTANRIVLERRPWGDGANATSRLTLSGGAAAAEGSATVIVSSAFGSNPEMARVVTSANGSIPAFDMLLSDVALVRLETVDGAGNVSTAVTTRDAAWIASLSGKVPGSIAENPHIFVKTNVAQETIDQTPRGGIEDEADELEIAALAQSGGSRVRVLALPSFEPFEPTGISPSARRDYAIAYDNTRGRTILFGGIDEAGQLLNDTWEFDGERWFEILISGVPPSPRSRPLMVYDAGRECTLLVGGESGSSVLNDAWCWNGERWSGLPAPDFDARRGASIAYHAELGLSVVFGGRRVANGLVQNDLWGWDGERWTLLPGGPRATQIGARMDAAMAYLPGSSGRLVVFGGRGGLNQLLDTTYSWNGIGWTQHTAAIQPSARARASMTSDSDPADLASPDLRVALYGGETAGSALSAETWTFDGAAWLNTTSLALDRPPARLAPWVHHVARDRFVLFGGTDNLATNTVRADTHAWNRTQWADLTPHALGDPLPRHGHGFASSGRHNLVFGGEGIDNGPWSFDARGWTFWAASATGPSARFGVGVAGLQPVPVFNQGIFVVFGGDDGNPFGLPQETWRFSAGPGTWTSYLPVQRPSGRTDHAMVRIDRAGTNQLLMFGGRDGQVFFNDTWTWDGSANTWTEHPRSLCANSPSTRFGASMTYDAANDRVVLFGGMNSSNIALNDLWEWNGTCWALMPAPASPAARRNAVMAYDPDRQRVYLFGGTGAPESSETTELPLGDLWMLRDSATPWIPVTPEPLYGEERFGGGATYDSTRSQFVMFGGQKFGVDTASAFLLTSGVAHRPGARFSVDWAAAEVPIDAIENIRLDASAGGRGFSRTLLINQNGAMVRIWDVAAGRWFVGGSNLADPGTPALMTYTTPNAGVARRLVAEGSQRLEAQILPLNVDSRNEISELGVDYIELRVTYRL
jgi:hypothetical protein